MANPAGTFSDLMERTFPLASYNVVQITISVPLKSAVAVILVAKLFPESALTRFIFTPSVGVSASISCSAKGVSVGGITQDSPFHSPPIAIHSSSGISEGTSVGGITQDSPFHSPPIAIHSSSGISEGTSVGDTTQDSPFHSPPIAIHSPSDISEGTSVGSSGSSGSSSTATSLSSHVPSLTARGIKVGSISSRL